jgi:parvulin-like peptidyl-prolyl isomerase
MARFARPLLLLLLPALFACRDQGVLAKVGSTKVRQADLDQYQAARGAQQRPAVEALRELGERTLLAEGARRRGLADDERVRARLQAAEREVLGQALLDQATEPLVTEEVLRARFEKEHDKLAKKQVHVAALMVALPRGQGSAVIDSARAKAQQLYGRLLKGDPLEKVCKEGSEDPSSVARGCDPGPLLEGQVDAAFFTAAAALKKDAVAPPVETSFALFVLKALEEPKVVQPTFEQARSRLEIEARHEGEAKLMADLHERIGVELHEDRIRPSAAKQQPAP